jgi:glucose/mannose transport system permease protein
MNRSRSRYWSYIPLVLLAIFYLIPVYVMVMTGFKGGDEISIKEMWK